MSFSIGFLLKLDDDFRTGRFGDVGDEVFDIELILIELFLYLLFDLIDTAIVLTLEFGFIVGLIAEETFLGWSEDLSDLFQS